MEQKLKSIEETFSTSRSVNETIYTIVSKLMNNNSWNYKLQSSMRDMTRMESMVIDISRKVIHRPFNYLSESLKNLKIKNIMVVNGVEIILVVEKPTSDNYLEDHQNYHYVVSILETI